MRTPTSPAGRAHLSRRCRKSERPRQGLSILELVVVLVVLAVLVAIAIPTFASVITRSKLAAEQTTASAILEDAQALATLAGRTTPNQTDIATATAETTALAAAHGVEAGGGGAPMALTDRHDMPVPSTKWGAVSASGSGFGLDTTPTGIGIAMESSDPGWAVFAFSDRPGHVETWVKKCKFADAFVAQANDHGACWLAGGTRPAAPSDVVATLTVHETTYVVTWNEVPGTAFYEVTTPQGVGFVRASQAYAVVPAAGLSHTQITVLDWSWHGIPSTPAAATTGGTNSSPAPGPTTSSSTTAAHTKPGGSGATRTATPGTTTSSGATPSAATPRGSTPSNATTLAVPGAQTYDVTGSVQTYTVPAGVHLLQVRAAGAQGARASTGLAGGRGGIVSTYLPVTPGEVLYAYLGAQPPTTLAKSGQPGGGVSGAPSTFGAGGPGNYFTSSTSRDSGGGGGATSVYARAPTAVDLAVVAGGGGGGGFCSPGGGGGKTGQTLVNPFDNEGHGGTQTAGGAAGPHGDVYSNATAGSFGSGGLGTVNGPGGGGGGGYYGGGGGGTGGGASGGGGGGGSSWVDATGQDTAYVTAYHLGNGAVSFTPAGAYAPSSLSARYHASTKEVAVSWTPSASTDVTGYVLYRTAVAIATLAPTATSYTDTSAPQGQRVVSYTLQATTAGLPSPPIQATADTVTPVTLVFSSYGDTNGTFYWIGTDHETTAFSNPTATGTGPVGVSASSYYGMYGAGRPWFSTDRTPSTRWTAGAPSGWITYDLKSYTLTPSLLTLDGTTSASVDVYGSHDGEHWTVIGSSPTGLSDGWTQIPLTGAGRYQYLRIAASSGSDAWVGITEAEFYGALQ